MKTTGPGRSGLRRSGLQVPRLHLVTDDRILARPDFLPRAGDALEAGGRGIALHLRGPLTSGRQLWELGRTLLPVARRHGALLIVNDRVDLALTLSADGAHLGGRSLSADVARQLLGPTFLLGRSVHPPAEPTRFLAEPVESRTEVSYLHAGTIFPSLSHPDRAGVGVEGFRALAAAHAGTPVLAIGGVTSERVVELLGAGAHGIAVVRAVWEVSRITAAVRGLLDEIEGAVDGSRSEGGVGVRRPA